MLSSKEMGFLTSSKQEQRWKLEIENEEGNIIGGEEVA